MIMRKQTSLWALFFFSCMFLVTTPLLAQEKLSKRQIQKIKTETLNQVQEQHKMTQVMIDKIFSFAELGFQEYESSAYLTHILEQAGFTVERGISGIPRGSSKRISRYSSRDNSRGIRGGISGGISKRISMCIAKRISRCISRHSSRGIPGGISGGISEGWMAEIKCLRKSG